MQVCAADVGDSFKIGTVVLSAKSDWEIVSQDLLASPEDSTKALFSPPHYSILLLTQLLSNLNQRNVGLSIN